MRGSIFGLACMTLVLTWGTGAEAQTAELPTHRGVRSARATVGSSGAELVLAQGARLRVPAAASTNGTLTVRTEAARRPWPFQHAFRAVGSALVLSGAVRGSRAPVEISLRVGRAAPRPRPGERLVYVIEHVGWHEVTGTGGGRGDSHRMVAAGANPIDLTAGGSTPSVRGMSGGASAPPGSGSDPQRETSLDPMLVRGHTGTGDSRAGAYVEPNIVRMPQPPGTGGDPRAGAYVEPNIVRTPRPEGTSGDPRAGAYVEPNIVRTPRPEGTSGDPRAGAYVEPNIVRTPRPEGGSGEPVYYLIGTASFNPATQSVTAPFPLDGQLRRVSFGFTSWGARAPTR